MVSKKSMAKKSLALTLAAVVTMSCTSTFAFASDKPSQSEAQYNNTETAISSELTSKVNEAVEKATEATEKAQEAAEAAAEVASEEAKAETAATNADTTATQAKTDTETATKDWNDGDKYVKDTTKSISEAVDASVEKINAEVANAKAEATKAETAATEAAQAKAEAYTAETVEEAQAAADKAKKAASDAKTAAENAQKAYDNANSELEKAEKAYNEAVEAAKTEVEAYNTKIGNLQTGVGAAQADVEDARRAFNEAKAKAEAAKAEAETAKTEADAANTAAQSAASAAQNFYVTPAQATVNAAQSAYNTAVANREAAQAVQVQKQAAYDAAVGTITANARAAQDAVVAQKQNELNAAQAAVNEAQKKVDGCNWWDYMYGKGEYYQIQLTKAKNARDNAQSALNNAKSESTYNSVINTWLNNSTQKAELNAAINNVNALSQVEAQKNTELANANAVLSNAETTRDSYIAAVKNELAANGDEAAAKIVADLKAYVASCSKEINNAEYYGDLYDWATDIFATWNKVEQGTARGEVGSYLETQKAKVDFWNKVGNVSILTAWATGRDDMINDIEAVYRAELLKSEEKVAFSEAYLAGEEGKDAILKAAQAEQAAQEAAAKLAAAETKLTTAEATYANAKTEIEKLTKLNLDVTAAKEKLEAAKTAVAEAKTAVEKANKELEKANAAKKDADSYLAQKKTGVKFFVLLPNNVRPTEGKGNATGNYTKQVGSMTLDRYDKEIAEDGIKFNIGKAGNNHTFCLEYLEGTAKSADKISNDSKAVEDILAARCDSYAENIKDIEKNALAELEKTYPNLVVTKTDENQKAQSYLITGIDWYEVKYVGNGFHCDGDVILAPIQSTVELITKDVYTNTETSIPGSAQGAEPIAIVQGNGTLSEDGIYTLDVPETTTDADGNVYTLVPGSNVLDIANGQTQMDVKYVREIDTTPKAKKSKKTTSNGETTLEDEEVPLSDLPTEVNLPDGDVPLSDMPEEELPDEEVPLAELPATGGIGMGIFLLVGGALAAAGTSLRRREDDK